MQSNSDDELPLTAIVTAESGQLDGLQTNTKRKQIAKNGLHVSPYSQARPELFPKGKRLLASEITSPDQSPAPEPYTQHALRVSIDQGILIALTQSWGKVAPQQLLEAAESALQHMPHHLVANSTHQVTDQGRAGEPSWLPTLRHLLGSFHGGVAASLEQFDWKKLLDQMEGSVVIARGARWQPQRDGSVAAPPKSPLILTTSASLGSHLVSSMHGNISKHDVIPIGLVLPLAKSTGRAPVAGVSCDHAEEHQVLWHPNSSTMLLFGCEQDADARAEIITSVLACFGGDPATTAIYPQAAESAGLEHSWHEECIRELLYAVASGNQVATCQLKSSAVTSFGVDGGNQGSLLHEHAGAQLVASHADGQNGAAFASRPLSSRHRPARATSATPDPQSAPPTASNNFCSPLRAHPSSNAPAVSAQVPPLAKDGRNPRKRRRTSAPPYPCSRAIIDEECALGSLVDRPPGSKLQRTRYQDQREGATARDYVAHAGQASSEINLGGDELLLDEQQSSGQKLVMQMAGVEHHVGDNGDGTGGKRALAKGSRTAVKSWLGEPELEGRLLESQCEAGGNHLALPGTTNTSSCGGQKAAVQNAHPSSLNALKRRQVGTAESLLANEAGPLSAQLAQGAPSNPDKEPGDPAHVHYVAGHVESADLTGNPPKTRTRARKVAVADGVSPAAPTLRPRAATRGADDNATSGGRVKSKAVLRTQEISCPEGSGGNGPQVYDGIDGAIKQPGSNPSPPERLQQRSVEHPWRVDSDYLDAQHMGSGTQHVVDPGKVAPRGATDGEHRAASSKTSVTDASDTPTLSPSDEVPLAGVGVKHPPAVPSQRPSTDHATPPEKQTKKVASRKLRSADTKAPVVRRQPKSGSNAVMPRGKRGKGQTGRRGRGRRGGRGARGARGRGSQRSHVGRQLADEKAFGEHVDEIRDDDDEDDDEEQEDADDGEFVVPLGPETAPVRSEGYQLRGEGVGLGKRGARGGRTDGGAGKFDLAVASGGGLADALEQEELRGQVRRKSRNVGEGRSGKRGRRKGGRGGSKGVANKRQRRAGAAGQQVGNPLHPEKPLPVNQAREEEVINLRLKQLRIIQTSSRVLRSFPLKPPASRLVNVRLNVPHLAGSGGTVLARKRAAQPPKAEQQPRRVAQLAAAARTATDVTEVAGTDVGLTKPSKDAAAAPVSDNLDWCGHLSQGVPMVSGLKEVEHMPQRPTGRSGESIALPKARNKGQRNVQDAKGAQAHVRSVAEVATERNIAPKLNNMKSSRRSDIGKREAQGRLDASTKIVAIEPLQAVAVDAVGSKNTMGQSEGQYQWPPEVANALPLLKIAAHLPVHSVWVSSSISEEDKAVALGFLARLQVVTKGL